MRYKQHNTKREVKFATIFYLIFGVIAFFSSVYFFLQNEIMNGLIFFSTMMMMLYFSKQNEDALNKRSLEEFICKVNSKRWEDFCNCEKCKAQQTFQKVEDK